MKSIPIPTCILAMMLISGPGCALEPRPQPKSPNREIPLPTPSPAGKMSVEEAVAKRRSVRGFSPTPLTLGHVSQLLWAAQGITHKGSSLRAAPSAGATYPLQLYVISNRVTGLNQGLFGYDQQDHSLIPAFEANLFDQLVGTAIMQSWIDQSALVIVVCADYTRTTSRYGERGVKYVHMEVGHVGQNISLQAVALGLGTTMVGAFHDEQLKQLLRLPGNLEPLYIIPVGFP